MARAKEAVEVFMELGAKYEVVLVGLADEVTKQRRIVESAEHNAAKSSESAANAAMQLEATRNEVSEALVQMRETLMQVQTTRELADAALQTIERCARVTKRNTLFFGALSALGMILGLVAFLG